MLGSRSVLRGGARQLLLFEKLEKESNRSMQFSYKMFSPNQCYLFRSDEIIHESYNQSRCKQNCISNWKLQIIWSVYTGRGWYIHYFNMTININTKITLLEDKFSICLKTATNSFEALYLQHELNVYDQNQTSWNNGHSCYELLQTNSKNNRILVTNSTATN